MENGDSHSLEWARVLVEGGTILKEIWITDGINEFKLSIRKEELPVMENFNVSRNSDSIEESLNSGRRWICHKGKMADKSRIKRR